MKKEICPKCKDMPEGEVIKGHDHSWLARTYEERITRLENVVLELASAIENGEYQKTASYINDLLANG